MITSSLQVFVADHSKELLGMLTSALTFIGGCVCTKYNVEGWFMHNRLWKRAGLCVLVLMTAVYFNFLVLSSVIFSVLLLLDVIFPLPHEWIMLCYYKKRSGELELKPNIWLVTTNALLSYHQLRIKKASNLMLMQDCQVQFLDEVEKLDLFDREYKKYYLPNLDVLYKIGAVECLKKKIAQLDRFKNDEFMLTLETYLAYECHDYEKMASMEKQCAGEANDVDAKLVALLNQLCAFEASGEKENITGVITELQEIKRKGVVHIELYHSLMHYYDEIACDKEAGNELAKEIENIRLVKFNDYLELQNVAFMHYRRIENYERIKAIVQKMLNENKIQQSGDSRKVTDIRFMYILFDNDCNWQEYSINLFLHRKEYLACGYRVGVEFIKETLRIIRDVRQFKSLNLEATLVDAMFSDFEKYSKQYIIDIAKDIAKIDDRFLYRKRELLMQKRELLNFIANDDIIAIRKNNEEIFERIIELCKSNGAEREYLHFLVVYIDDILTIDNQVQDEMACNNIFASSSMSQEYQKQRPVYINYAEELVNEVLRILEKRKYDKSMAYYVLYAAYFYKILGNQLRSQFYLMRFQKYGVDIKNWTVVIQNLYRKLQEVA